MGVRTKIDANGTLINFVAHGEDVYVVCGRGWRGGVEVQKRWAASNFLTNQANEIVKILAGKSLIDNTFARSRGEARTLHLCV